MDYTLRLEAHPQDLSLIHMQIFQNPKIFQTHSSHGPKGFRGWLSLQLLWIHAGGSEDYISQAPLQEGGHAIEERS